MGKNKGTVTSRHNLNNRTLTLDTRILQTDNGGGRAMVHLPTADDVSRCTKWQDAEYIYYGTLRNAGSQDAQHRPSRLKLCRGCFQNRWEQPIPDVDALAEYVSGVVDSIPALSEQQRAQLALIIRTTEERE
jgi:hypothetical protein